MTIARPVELFDGEGPGFNREAARTVYGQIMAMDADSATVYSRMLVGAAVQNDLIVHQDEIETQVAKALAHRVELAKKQLTRTSIAKARSGEDNTTELRALVEITKGNWFDFFSPAAKSERAKKQRRDLTTGRFQVMHEKIDHTPGAAPVPGPYAGKLGIPEPPVQLRPEMQAAYQNGYYQIARMIRPFVELPAGDGRLTFHYSDGTTDHATLPHGADGRGNINIPLKRPEKTETDNEGNTKVVQAEVKDGLDATKKVEAITLDVVPGINAQGAAFSTLNALGLPGLGGRAAAAMGEKGALNPHGVNSFEQSWNQKDDADEVIPSQRIFRRLHAGSQFIEDTLGATAPPHVKMALAAAKHVGHLGPAAQKLLGPTLDRAAYRYRGTEKAPEPGLRRALDDVQSRANRADLRASLNDRDLREALGSYKVRLNTNAATYRDRVGEANTEWRKIDAAYKAGRVNRAEWKAAAKRNQKALELATSRRKNADDAAEDELASARKQHRKGTTAAESSRVTTGLQYATRGFPDDDGRWNPGEVLAFMQKRVPSPALNELQLKAGHIPPSEGLILDANGKIAAQTHGFGDDHYVPFTLRNLAKLKNGYYIRTRTYGGPTTEDFRTAFLAGARGFTVVSNTGVFVVDFDEDFKGGRRFNDKAARITGRYGHLLDAIKHGKIDGAEIDPTRMQEIYRKARAAYPDDPTGFTAEVEKLKVRERNDPHLSDQQVSEIAGEYLNDRLYEQGLTSGDRLLTLDELAGVLGREYADRAKQADPSMTAAVKHGIAQMKGEELRRASSASDLAYKLAGETGDVPGLSAALDKGKEDLRRSMQPLKLNARGYATALHALHEQFPYYIKQPQFFRFPEGKDGEDTGYVKPNFNRPEAALGGWYDGTIGGKPVGPNNIPPAGKFRADTIRWQNGQKMASAQGVKTTAADTEGQAAAAGAKTDPASPEALYRARNRADRDLLEHILMQSNFRPTFKLLAGKSPESVAPATAAADPNAPGPLKAMFGVQKDKLLAEQAEDPERFHATLMTFLDWNDQQDALKLDRTMVERARHDGKPPEVKAFNAEQAISNPRQEWQFAHIAPAFDKNRHPTKVAVGEEYKTNGLIKPLINTGDLPGDVGEDGFDDKVIALAAKLDKLSRAEDDWQQGPKIGMPPVSRAEINRRAEGMARALTLRHRFKEAVQAEAEVEAREKAAAEERREPAPVEHNTNQLQLMVPAEVANLPADKQKAYMEMVRQFAANAAGAPVIENPAPPLAPLTPEEIQQAQRHGLPT